MVGGSNGADCCCIYYSWPLSYADSNINECIHIFIKVCATLFYRVFSCRKTFVTLLSLKGLKRIIWRSDLCWLIYVLLLFSRELWRHLGRVEKRLLMWFDSLAREENEERACEKPGEFSQRSGQRSSPYLCNKLHHFLTLHGHFLLSCIPPARFYSESSFRFSFIWNFQNQKIKAPVIVTFSQLENILLWHQIKSRVFWHKWF